MAVYLLPQKLMNRTVARVDGVHRVLVKRAKKIVRTAEGLHQTYHDPTDETETSFSVTEGDVDAFANMDHPAALYIELGWIHPKSGKHVPGKYTMNKAAGL